MASLAQLTVRTPDAAVRLYFDAMRRAAAHTICLEDLDRGTHGWRDGHTVCRRSFSFLLAQDTDKGAPSKRPFTPAPQLFSVSLTTSSVLLRRFIYPYATFLLRTSKIIPTEDGVDELAPHTWALGDVKSRGLRTWRICCGSVNSMDWNSERRHHVEWEKKRHGRRTMGEKEHWRENRRKESTGKGYSSPGPSPRCGREHINPIQTDRGRRAPRIPGIPRGKCWPPVNPPGSKQPL